MKKTLLLILCIAVTIGSFLFSSCGHKQRVKMIPASHVKLSGEHKGLIEVAADSVKIMLVETYDNTWEVRALIPIRNTAAWSDITGGSDEYNDVLDARMSNVKVHYIDQYGSEIKEIFNGLDIDHDAIESIMLSEHPNTEDVLIKDKSGLWGEKSHRVKKNTFKKVDGIVISQINITKGQGKNFDESMERIERILGVLEHAAALGL
ncbi:MAG: hypothetical protein J5526_06660 [Bacteroidales bacterium]|nr:hypothetical protein [Bacteroidales bacterium]